MNNGPVLVVGLLYTNGQTTSNLTYHGHYIGLKKATLGKRNALYKFCASHYKLGKMLVTANCPQYLLIFASAIEEKPLDGAKLHYY